MPTLPPMRTANLRNRLVLIADDQRALDVERASDGRFDSDPQAIFERWGQFVGWAGKAPLDDAEPFELESLGPPVPRPRQLFAIGLNYGDHVAETNSQVSPQPPVFTKFSSSITGPYDSVEHPGGSVDWEVELVVVVGDGGRRIPAERAWAHLAGLTIGQDISERDLQHAGHMPQFSLGKSFAGFAPMGPWLATPDEFENPDDLALGCSVNGEVMQESRTSFMLASVPDLIAQLSAVTQLMPGDVIFTGTPAGVGLGREPKVFLAPGDEIVSYVEGIGEMRNRLVAPVAVR